LIDLKAVPAGTTKASGEKVYRYPFDGDRLTAMGATVERRARPQPSQFLVKLHGPQMDPGPEDDDEEIRDNNE
jgi:hypothetical protein